MANPLDHKVDLNPNIDVPGKLRAEAKRKKAAGEFRLAKDMEDEATRVELKRKQANVTPGQRAVIRRLHGREGHMDGHLLTSLIAGGIALAGLVVLVKKGRGGK